MKSIVRSHKRYATILSALAVFLLLGFYAMLNTLPENTYALSQPVIIGHRGSANGVENTIPAIQAAIRAGADYAEVDVRLSRDNIPVVFHDETLDTLAGRSGRISDYTAAELQQIPLHQNGATGSIPTLQQVLDICRGKIKLLIELKPCGDIALLEQVGALLAENNAFGTCVVMSQRLAVLADFRDMYPSAIISYCRYNTDDGLSASGLQALGIEFLVVSSMRVTPALLADAKEAGLPVYVCTVNEARHMRGFLAMGADGLVTDRPAIASEVAERMIQEMNARSSIM